MSLGGSSGKNNTSSSGSSTSSATGSSTGYNQDYGTNIWGPQGGYLNNLYAQAEQLNNSRANMQTGNDAYGQSYAGQQQLQNLSGANAGLNYQSQSMPWYLQGVGNEQAVGQLGSQGMAQIASQGGNNPALAAYSRQIGQQFAQNILPQLNGQTMGANAFGSSRAGIGQGLAAAQAGQQLQDFGAMQYNQDQDRRLQANQALQQYGLGVGQNQLQGANLQSQYAQQGGAQQLQNMAQQAQAAQAMGGMALDRGTFGMGVPWYGLQQYGGILGGPVMQDLGGMGSTSSSNSSYGDQYSTSSGRASDYSRSVRLG